ncbi:MAG TPA: hypothetical protein DEB43_08000 [Desulfovibrio sp.]|nr:hypothetical protein [Desulfovibrio sp.]
MIFSPPPKPIKNIFTPKIPKAHAAERLLSLCPQQAPKRRTGFFPYFNVCIKMKETALFIKTA